MSNDGIAIVDGVEFQVLAGRYWQTPNLIPGEVIGVEILCKGRDDIDAHIFCDDPALFRFSFQRSSIAKTGGIWKIQYEMKNHGSSCSVYFGEHELISQVEGSIDGNQSPATINILGKLDSAPKVIEFSIFCELVEDNGDSKHTLNPDDFA